MEAEKTRLCDRVTVESELKRQAEEERNQLRTALQLTQKEMRRETLTADRLRYVVARSQQRVEEIISSLEFLKGDVASSLDKLGQEEIVRQEWPDCNYSSWLGVQHV